MVKAKELRDQTDQQLQILVEDIGKELFEMNNELATNRKVDKPHLFNEKKKTRARALTILRERQLKVESKRN